MFTGLVQTTGSLRPWQGDQVLVIPDQELGPLAVGDSVAVDGVCLTVAATVGSGFIADLSPETRRRSTLGSRTPAQRVNLEPSLRVGDKLGGHFVTGHIDGVGELLEIEATATAWELTFGIPETLGSYVVPKGSIAINGISLTIAALEREGIRVAVIPHTYAATNLKDLQLGDPVNVEGDILGKYVERYLEKYFHKSAQHSSSMESDLSLAFLQEHGYL